MGKNSSSTKSRQISTLNAGQQSVADALGSQLSNTDLLASGLDLDMLDEMYGGNTYAKEVSSPMMRTFNEYVKPQINQSFRKGGLFSSAKSTAITRALGDLTGSLTTELANREWNTTQARANAITQSIYTPTATQQIMQSYLGTPMTENLTWAEQSGNFFNTIGGQALTGAGMISGASILGGGTAFGSRSLWGNGINNPTGKTGLW